MLNLYKERIVLSLKVMVNFRYLRLNASGLKSHAAWDFTKTFPSLVPESLFVALFVDLELIWNLFFLLWIINALKVWVLFCEFIFHVFKYEISSHARGFFIFTFSYMSCIWTQINFLKLKLIFVALFVDLELILLTVNH